MVKRYFKPDRDDVTDEFSLLLVRLAAAFPTTGKVSAATAKSYARILDDVAIADVVAACERASRECRFFPSAAELLSFAVTPTDDAGILAWAGFRSAAEDVGAYASLEVEDGAAAHALLLAFGSWPAYCELDDGATVAARRAEFAAAYRDARRRRIVGPTRLAGTCEQGGSYRGGARLVVGRLAATGATDLVSDSAYVAPTSRVLTAVEPRGLLTTGQKLLAENAQDEIEP